MKVLATCYILMCCFFIDLSAQPVDYEFSPLKVTALRLSDRYLDLSRSITVIDSQMIARSSARSIQELLALAPGLDVLQRGPLGIQSEIRLRGGSIEETLIMVDGIVYNDPQTGHHNMDLPVNLEDVRRIEILKGPGSALYGADAAAGIIHIITGNEHGSAATLYGGDYETLGIQTRVSRSGTGFRSSVSLKTFRSGGYRHNTDYDQQQIYARMGYGRINTIDVTAGFLSKSFGANGFYTDRFPNQFEETSTTVLAVQTSMQTEYLTLRPQVSWKRHTDEFRLDFERPDWYLNEHETRVLDGQLPLILQFGNKRMIFGLDLKQESIVSSNLGNHVRRQLGGYAGIQLPLKGNGNVSAAAHIHRFGDREWRVWPDAGISLRFAPRFKWHLHAGKAFRMPTFTELYYNSPANQGNPDLDYSESWSVDSGMTHEQQDQRQSVTLYFRRGENQIDWIRSGNDPWQAVNIRDLKTLGIEGQWIHRLRWKRVDQVVLALVVQQSSLEKKEWESKYPDGSLQKAGLDMSGELASIRYAIMINGIQRPDQRYALVNVKLHRTLFGIGLELSIHNLFDTRYFDIIGVPMPGRWGMMNMRITW